MNTNALVKVVRTLSRLAFIPGLLAALYAVLGGFYLVTVLIANLGQARRFSDVLSALVFPTLIVAAIVSGFWLYKGYGSGFKRVWLYSFIYNLFACAAMIWAVYEVLKRLSYLTFVGWQWLYVILPSVISLWTLSVSVLSFLVWRSVKS